VLDILTPISHAFACWRGPTANISIPVAVIMVIEALTIDFEAAVAKTVLKTGSVPLMSRQARPRTSAK
jgi:hypothetical protein